MFEERIAWLRRPGNAALVRHGLRGVEKESLRVDADGRLSQRPHPKALGAALTHPHITTDYSEALLELVTPPQRHNWQTLAFLCDLHAFIVRRLDGELMWPASMPCVLDPEHRIPIARYGSSNLGRMKTVYRRGLGYRYGRAMQAIAGVHFNYSPPGDLWAALREREGGDAPEPAFKSAGFMGLVRNYRRLAWLPTYLFGASPALCKSFRPEGHELLQELDGSTWYAPYATSLRMSGLGYRNKTQARLSISANSLEEYVAGLTAALTTVEPSYAAIGVLVDGDYRQLNANILQIENEYYSAIRPKPAKDNKARPVAALRERGVEYVEVRTLDLSPADPVGVNQAELRFLESLLLYCLLAPSPPLTAEEQARIEARDLLVAAEGRRPGLRVPWSEGERTLAEAGLPVLDGVEQVAELLDEGGEGYAAAVRAAREALRDPDATPSAALLRDLEREGQGFFAYALALARRHRDYFAALPAATAAEDRLAALAAASLQEAEALEAADEVPFDEYLRRHFEAIRGPAIL
ncbi:MAG TPA: glutamate--cysteine ligase [Gammaproteobacteria bacterium]